MYSAVLPSSLMVFLMRKVSGPTRGASVTLGYSSSTYVYAFPSIRRAVGSTKEALKLSRITFLAVNATATQTSCWTLRGNGRSRPKCLHCHCQLLHQAVCNVKLQAQNMQSIRNANLQQYRLCCTVHCMCWALCII